jgi:aubergine
MDCAPPRMIKVQGNDNNFATWKNSIDANLKARFRDINCVIFVLPGQKGKGKCYSEIKKYLIEEVPIPSQVVLGSTIAKGKNLRSIVNKVVIQMNAKMGGVPWSISHMPFTQSPTMVIGLSSAKAKGAKNVYSIAATMNREFNRFFSKSVVSEHSQIEEMIVNSIQAFQSSCGGKFPSTVIVLRDGVGDSQKDMLMTVEIP